MNRIPIYNIRYIAILISVRTTKEHSSYKVEIPLCLIKHRDVYTYSAKLSNQATDSVRFRLRPFISAERAARLHPLNRTLGGLQNMSGSLEARDVSCCCRELNSRFWVVQPLTWAQFQRAYSGFN
jgi:hypothetical protein